MSNIARLVLGIALAVLLAPSAIAQEAPPTCTGKDMLAELQTTDPPAYARIRAAADATINTGAILWRIDGGSAAPSYLFGTVHLTDDRVNALSPNVKSALDSAQRIALEVADLSPKSVAAAMTGLRDLMVFRDGRKLDALLAPQEFDIAKTALGASGVPPEAAAALRPWIVTMSLALTPCERRRSALGLKPLDMRLGEIGQAHGVPVVGLETLQSQFRAMAEVPESDQLDILRVSLRLYGRSQDLLETVVERYLARDVGAVWPLQIELAKREGFSVEVFKSFEQHLLGNRNVTMRDAALPLLQQGGTFIAVGALHLPGTLGLVQQLRGAGYRLTPVE